MLLKKKKAKRKNRVYFNLVRIDSLLWHFLHTFHNRNFPQSDSIFEARSSISIIFLSPLWNSDGKGKLYKINVKNNRYLPFIGRL